MSQPDLSKEQDAPAVIINEKPSLVELKNGKVVFKQKPISFDKMSETMQEIVKFREMLEQRIERRDPPLIVFPDEHKPLIAKLAHESDKTLIMLAKHIRLELLPTQDEDDDFINSGTDVTASLPLSLIEVAIKSVLSRNNYGLDALPGGGKLPAALCIWRWEVKEEYHDWLPKASRERADARLAERVQAKKDLAAFFETLSQAERNKILDPKGTMKLPTKDTNKVTATSVSPSKTIDTESRDSPQTSKKQQKQKVEDAENDVSEATTSKLGRPKKETDPEKVTKENERLEKKAAKAEREKKEREAQNKSRSLMANFFGKPKTNSARASPAQESDTAVAGPSSNQSEFEKTFKPFVVKKDAEIAPSNWFMNVKTNRLRKKTGEREIIIIDDDGTESKNTVIDIDMEEVQEISYQVSRMNLKEHLASTLSTLPPSASPSLTTAPRRELYTSHLTVRTILSLLSEAEIADNPTRVRALLSILRNRTLLPAKVLIFVEDARPGYFGTWTRHSHIIGPRKPFARDLVALDYTYDSGEEWEEEGDADDVVEGAEDEDGDGVTEADSDLDSWLVDDDDIGDVDIDADVEELGTPLEGKEVETLPPVINIQPKRKAEEDERKIEKKRKVVVPLVPFAKGPCWEHSIGACAYEPFQTYRIQLFNDIPHPIDPFTFISVPPETRMKVIPSTPSTFAVPSLPDRLLPIPINGMPSMSVPSIASGPVPAMKRTSSAPAPKTTFPDAHLPLLLSKIAALATPNINFLVDSIYQDLRTHRVKKNAIEAKVREIGEKCKERKVWIIKPNIAVPVELTAK